MKDDLSYYLYLLVLGQIKFIGCYVRLTVAWPMRWRDLYECWLLLGFECFMDVGERVTVWGHQYSKMLADIFIG